MGPLITETRFVSPGSAPVPDTSWNLNSSRFESGRYDYPVLIGLGREPTFEFGNTDRPDDQPTVVMDLSSE